jgi:hypothetical protein
LQVFLYDKWPGDLSAEMKKRDPQFPEPRMELAIHVVVKEITQGYQRETLAQVAAQDALDELVAYLIGLRATT